MVSLAKGMDTVPPIGAVRRLLSARALICSDEVTSAFKNGIEPSTSVVQRRIPIQDAFEHLVECLENLWS